MKNHIRNNMLITALVLFTVGLALILWPKTSQKLLVFIAGGLFILYGIIKEIVHYRAEQLFTFDTSFLSGILSILIGILFLVRASVIVGLFGTLLGLAVTLGGIVKLQSALRMRSFELPHWKAYLITSIVSVFLGLLLLVDPFSGVNVFTYITGAILIIESLAWIWGVIELRRHFIDG